MFLCDTAFTATPRKKVENIMTGRSRSESWIEEFCYFGNANWPESATYRRRGSEVQIRSELPIQLEMHTDPQTGLISYHGTPTEVEKFLVTYLDCTILMRPGYVTATDERATVPPRLYMIGWSDVTTPEEIEQYERDKRDGMKRPS